MQYYLTPDIYLEGKNSNIVYFKLYLEGKQITKFFDNKGYHKMLQREKHLQVNVKIQHIFAIESKINVTTP